MPLNFLNNLLLLAAAQGIFLTLLIFHKHNRQRANRYLGVLILLYSILLLHLYFDEMFRYSNQTPQLTICLIGLGFLVPPLHYLYARRLIFPAQKLRKTVWIHGLPLILYELVCLPLVFRSKDRVLEHLNKHSLNGLPADYVFYDCLMIAVIFFYMIRTLIMLNRYAHHIRDLYSSIEKIRLTWLRNITYFAIVLAGVFLIENILLIFNIRLFYYFGLSSILAAVYVYAMGYMGLYKTEIFSAPGLTPVEEEWPSTDRTEKKYGKSGLSPKKADEIRRALLQLMETKQPFVDPEINLQQLADMLSVTPHNLSEIINTQLHKNFFDFVNHYRIEKIKQDILDPNKSNFTLLALALDAGFNSKTAFNTVFKKLTGLTPTEFKKSFSN